MKLKLLTWNSININDGSSYNAYIPPPQMANQSNNPVLVNRANEYPFLSVAQRNASFITINVIVAAGQNINDKRELLKKYFFADLNRHNLVAQDENDSNRQYYRTGIPISLTQEGNNINSFLISIQTEYPYWQIVTATADSWDITVSGDSDVIANIGNINVPPVFTITPTTTKTKGLKYRSFSSIYNLLDKSFNSPFDVWWNTSFYDSDKVQPSLNDVRVWQDGSFMNAWATYWQNNPANGFGSVWANETLAAKKDGVLLSTIDSDDTTLYFTQTRANLKFLQSMKTVSNHLLHIDYDSDGNSDELLSFQDSDIDIINYTISNISRGQKNSSISAHISTTVHHVEHDTWVMYGDSDLSAPDNNDDNKPIFNLYKSYADIWNYDSNAFFFDNTANRPASFIPEVLDTKTGLSYTFTGNENTFVNPATVMGISLIGGSDFQSHNEAGMLTWMISHPCGFDCVEYEGEIYRTGATPAVVGLQYLQPDTGWFTAQLETVSSASSEWIPFATHTVDLGNGYESLRFIVNGELDNIIDQSFMYQVKGITLNLKTANVPIVVSMPEESINFFDFKLTNNTTGEYIKVQSPCPVNSSLTIDCANKKAYLQDGSPVNVILSTDRQSWLDLQPGNNSLQYDDIGTVAVNIVISHRDRIL